MKQQKGFTLIELMIVIAIVGILAIIAIPVYLDYTIRAKVSEGMNLTSAAKIAVSEVYSASGSFPDDNSEAGLPAPLSIIGTNVASISVVSNGVIRISYGNNLGSNADGETINLTPTAMEGSVTWVCTAGSMPGKYRPPNCR